MTWVVMSIGMLSAAVLQTSLPGCVWLAQAKFPFLLSVVLYYALCRESGAALIAGFFAGLLHDLLGQIPLGYSTLTFWVFGLVVSRFRRVVVTDSVVTSVFFGAATGFVVTFILYVLLTGAGQLEYPVWRALWKATGTGLLGALCTPLAFAAMSRLDRLVGNVERKEDFDGIGW